MGGIVPPGSSRQPGNSRISWDRPEPCYCKINQTTGLIALSLTSFKTLHEKESLAEQLLRLHRLHLELDAVVIRHRGAVKFSGSSESYLVAASSNSAIEAAMTVKNIAEELISVNKDIKGVVSFGEVGFALLGSTAWNYQFYGELVTDLKIKAEELRSGEMKLMPCLVDVLQSCAIADDEICSSQILAELRRQEQPATNTTGNTPESNSDLTEDRFHDWWASRVQYTDIWVLILTFIFAAVSIRNQAVYVNDLAKVPLLPLFLQVNCCLVNLFATFGWVVNRDWFIQRHSVIMSVVWCTQFFSRGVQAWTLTPRPSTFLKLPIQLFAMNGPEKLMLMTAPVNLWISGLLHWFGFVGSLGIVYRNCQSENGAFDPTLLPSDVISSVLISFVVFFVLPMAYSIRVEKSARTNYDRHRSNKLKGKEN